MSVSESIRNFLCYVLDRWDWWENIEAFMLSRFNRKYCYECEKWFIPLPEDDEERIAAMYYDDEGMCFPCWLELEEIREASERGYD